jgi:hypothetical protein
LSSVCRPSAQVLDCLAHVVLRQTYANPAYATTLDCEYTFPMDPSAAVNRLVVTVGDRVVHGVVMERAAADARFDEAVAVGDGAYRVARSPTSADVFLASIGNLLPGETAVVQIEYVAPVALEGSCLRFCLPTAVAPRYAGLTPWTTRFAASTVPAQFPLRVSVDFAVASDIVTVGCPGARMAAVGSHDGGQPEVVGPGVFAGAWHGGCVEASVGRSAAVVTLSVPDSVGLESDFVVTVAEVQPHQPRVWVERFVAGEVASGVADAPAAAAETEAVMVAMYPDLANATYARDPQLTYTFILDCSGSMGGSNIARAKQALALCLRSLPVASHFQVVAFGWKFHSAFEDGPRQYNDASLAAATDFVLALQANLGTSTARRVFAGLSSLSPLRPVCVWRRACAGGTEIRAPLKAAFAGANRNTPLQVFLFTDGSVADTDAVVADCKRGFAETGSRVFTFGIGTDASAALVRGCAEAAGGQAEFIMGDEPMDEKVLRQVRRSGSCVAHTHTRCYHTAHSDGRCVPVLTFAAGALNTPRTYKRARGLGRLHAVSCDAELARGAGAIVRKWASAGIRRPRHFPGGPANRVWSRTRVFMARVAVSVWGLRMQHFTLCLLACPAQCRRNDLCDVSGWATVVDGASHAAVCRGHGSFARRGGVPVRWSPACRTVVRRSHHTRGGRQGSSAGSGGAGR